MNHISMEEKFYAKNDMIDEAPDGCPYKLGDMVDYTNEYGVQFKYFRVIGFAKPQDHIHGRYVHISSDSPWFPVDPKNLTPSKRPETPECTKLHSIKHLSQTIHDFMEYCDTEGVKLCSADKDREYHPITEETFRKLLAKNFDIDMDKVENEKEELLQYLHHLHAPKEN